MILQGKTNVQVSEIKAGDIGAVAKLKETQSGRPSATRTPRSNSPR